MYFPFVYGHHAGASLSRPPPRPPSPRRQPPTFPEPCFVHQPAGLEPIENQWYFEDDHDTARDLPEPVQNPQTPAAEATVTTTTTTAAQQDGFEMQPLTHSGYTCQVEADGNNHSKFGNGMGVGNGFARGDEKGNTGTSNSYNNNNNNSSNGNANTNTRDHENRANTTEMGNNDFDNHDRNKPGSEPELISHLRIVENFPPQFNTNTRGCEIAYEKPLRKRLLFPTILIVIIFILAGCTASIVVAVYKEKHFDRSPRPIPSSEETEPVALNSSNIAMAGSSFTGFRGIYFQDDDGDLGAIEWQTTGSHQYKLQDYAAGAEKAPKPIEGSPLHALRLGDPSNQETHLFYIDESMSLTHLVRRKGFSDAEWEPGSLSTEEGKAKIKHRASNALRLSVAVIPSDFSPTSEQLITVMCQTNSGPDTVMLMSTDDPDSPSSWDTQEVSLGADSIDMPMHPTSSGFLLLPVARKISEEHGTHASAGLRILWDLDDESQKTTFGSLECAFNDKQELDRCSKASNN